MASEKETKTTANGANLGSEVTLWAVADKMHNSVDVVRLLVQMLTRYKGRIYDPCCGGLLVATSASSA
jgi:hypothetical protein